MEWQRFVRLRNDRIDGEQLLSTAYQGGSMAW